MWAALFSLNSTIVLIAWALLAFFPRKPLTGSIILYLGVGLLCLSYAALLILVTSGSIDPGLPAGTAEVAVSFNSIAGVRGIFQSDSGVLIGWTHYLAFDLFIGLWISKDADAKGFSRIAQLPILFATLMAGPIGLLLWLVIRESRARMAGRAR